MQFKPVGFVSGSRNTDRRTLWLVDMRECNGDWNGSADMKVMLLERKCGKPRRYSQ